MRSARTEGAGRGRREHVALHLLHVRGSRLGSRVASGRPGHDHGPGTAVLSVLYD